MKPFTILRSACVSLAVAGAVSLAGSPAAAQTDYPTRTVTLIVPFGAGGGTDNLVRTFLPVLQEELGQPVVVDNRPGAGSVIGTEAVVRAAPDGYSVLVVDSAILTNPSLRDNLPYETMSDLEPVSMLATGPVVLIAHPDADADTLDELLDIARERPATVPFAHGGHGASTHLALELLQLVTDVEFNPIPYQGTGPATTDLVAGHVQYMFNGISASRPHLDADTVKALAVTGDERHPAIPDVPTFAELGYAKVNAMSIWGAWVPTGTPPEAIEKLSEAFSAAVNHPSVADTLIGLGFFTIGSTPEEYRDRATAEMATWAETIDTAGIELE
jgi:tripartite-type tricarboxylate transporter receptor subunit TctC